MTKIFNIAILNHTPSSSKEVLLLAESQDLSSFNYFSRNSASEFMTFTSRIIAQRTKAGSRQSVQQQEYMCHCYVRTDNLAGVILADNEYASRIAYTLISKLLEEFIKCNQFWIEYNDIPTRNTCEKFPDLKVWLEKYQDPQKADSLCRVQRELDETKVVLHQTLEGLLNRGEKLDDLVNRSEMLSSSSKAFYTTAKKTNSWCCTIM